MQAFPHIRIVGEHVWPDGTDREVEAYYAASRQSVQFENELSKTPEQLEMIEAIRKGLKAFGEDMGVDLSGRLLRPEEYHFFGNAADFMQAATKAKIIVPPGTQATKSLFGGVLMQSSGDRSIDAYLAVHETLHFINSEEVLLIPDGEDSGDVVPLGAGHMVRVDATTMLMHGAEESLTDMGTVDVLRHYMPERFTNPGVRGVYRGFSLVLGALFARLHRERGIPPFSMYRRLYRDGLTGHSSGWREIDQCAGRSGMRAIIACNNEGRSGIVQRWRSWR